MRQRRQSGRVRERSARVCVLREGVGWVGGRAKEQGRPSTDTITADFDGTITTSGNFNSDPAFPDRTNVVRGFRNYSIPSSSGCDGKEPSSTPGPNGS
jgi:hypothetical protein